MALKSGSRLAAVAQIVPLARASHRGRALLLFRRDLGVCGAIPSFLPLLVALDRCDFVLCIAWAVPQAVRGFDFSSPQPERGG